MFDIFDECLNEVSSLLSGYLPKTNENVPACKDAGTNQMLFRSDTAFELGGKNLPAISSIMFADNANTDGEDEVVLYGPDLKDISEASPYARITIVGIDGSSIGDGNELYSTMRQIDYIRYHVNPEGFMMRISPVAHKECINVGKAAVSNGISLFGVGKTFIQAYKKNPNVKSVKIIFITQKDFPYDKLSNVAIKSENITKALDHLMSGVKMDCDTCGLQEICAKVEEMLDL